MVKEHIVFFYKYSINPKTLKMKRTHLLLSGLALFLVTSCQKEESVAPDEVAKETQLTVKYIAKNYDNPDIDREEMNKIADAYLTLDSEQMKEFFQLRSEIVKDQGMAAEEVDTKLNLLLEVNDKVVQETGKSYAQVDSKKLKVVYNEVSKQEKYQLATSENTERVASCYGGSWTNSGTFAFYRYSSSTADNYTYYYTIGWAGLFNFGGTSDDCDLVFRSSRYPSSRRARYLVASTARAINAMRGRIPALRAGTETRVPAKQLFTSSSRTEIRAEIGVGQGRVNANYPFQGANTFAREVWVATRNQ